MASNDTICFDLFVTCIDRLGPMLKIWGQVDRLSSMFVEQLLKTTSPQFELEAGTIHLSKLSVGLLCCAKYKDGLYYRAQIISLRHLVSGSVEVKFIDYGNVEIITIENLRLLENVPLGLTTIKAQAVDFILANAIHVNHKWDDQVLAFIHSEISYMEVKGVLLGAINKYKFIKLMFHENDLADYLVQRGIATPVTLAIQETMLNNPRQEMMMAPQYANVAVQAPVYPQRTVVQQAQPQYHQQQQFMPPMPTPEFCNFKTLPLEPNSEHMVYVSYVEDGPFLFAVQLQSMEDTLEKLMIEINQISNILPLTEPPVPGHPCMARCVEDNSLCRAVVVSTAEDKCKTYFVDFGNTDILPFSNIFQIPFKYVLPKVMSMRFTLSGLKNIKVTDDMKCAFKEYVTNRLLRLKVLDCSTPVMQYCELFDENNTNIINILYDQMNEYRNIPIGKNMKYNVIVSFIEGCKKFFVQLKEYSDSLNNLMLALATTCENANVLQNLEVGTPCVAFYSVDNQWYRAEILSVVNNTATVKYVDYGNEDTVPLNCLKKIDPSFVKILPIQAIECCLYGYQNMSFNNEIESVFESLTLECEFTMRVISKQNNDKTLLVDLFDTEGNNVAALLIEKLASQKSQISPLPVNKILNNEENVNPNAENNYVEIKSPKVKEKSSWNTKEDKKSWNSDEKKSWSTSEEKKPSWGEEKKSWGGEKKSWGEEKKPWGEEKKSFKNKEDRSSWRRSSDDSPPKNRQNDNWNGDSPTNKRSQRNERSERPFPRKDNSFQPREGGKFKRSPPNDFGKSNAWNSGSESEKSWSGSVGSKGKSKDRKWNDFPKKNDFVKERRKPVELPPQDFAPLTQPFDYMEIAPESTESVSISWFYNPENFFCQLTKSEKEFRDTMNDIQSAYKGRPPLNGDIPIGASVIAEFHEDSVLYRATILENKFPKYKVQYVDFGNMSLVDSSKIWQVEKNFMNLPMQAIKCSIINISPSESDWTASKEIDNFFNKETFTCSFVGCDAEKYFIQLFDNDIDIRQLLIDSGIAKDPTAACEMADEPVDLNTLICQTIKVRISFIHGLSKFYIHLQLEKALIVSESIDSYMKTCDIASLPQLSQEQITIGATCLVQDNNSWKRGVITDNSDLTAVKIEFPDYGGSQIYSTDKIFVLPQELCKYWYQGFECSLHNLTDEARKLVSDEEFKQGFEGQEVIIYIDEIENGRLIVTLYDLTGSKLELIDPDEGAYQSVEPICPMPIFSATLSVYVTHVNNVNSLYLQNNSDANKIADLLERLYEFYETQGESKEFKNGDYCCAKSENDGNWYRGKVEEITEENIKVLYIDYGNFEHLSKENLKVLDLAFFEHELAINVGLNLEEVSLELTNKIIELTADKLFTANIFYGENGWIVELSNTEINVNQTLIDLNLAKVVDGVETQETIIEETESDLISANETRAQINITHIDSPSEFYVQLVSNEESIFALQANLQEKVAELPDLEGADIGVLCAAKYTVDEQWYRAEVLDADSEITTVRFVDYGNTDVINNNSGSIKTLPADLLAIDKYARKCSLNIAPNKGEEWSQEASELFENAVNSDVIYADIVYQDEKNKTYVDLFVNQANIAEQLLQANLAVAITRDAEDKLANNTGFVSHINTISEFWIQLESSVPDLEMIADRLANADTFSDLLDYSPGILCAANFPDDEMWYRARILSNTVAGIEVLFVDYGNSSTAIKLKVLPEDLIQMPILAQKCSLNKPNNVTNWSEAANDKFKEISEDGATIFTIKKLTAGETSIVELFVEGNSILDQLIEFCDEKSDRLTPIGQPNLIKAYVTHIESPNYFWVQLSSDSEKIEEMTENLATAGGFKKLIDYDADTTCAVLYLESGLWYRAKILENLENNYEVLLVDYGNIINTQELRILPDDIANIPPLANLCALELPKDSDSWTDEQSTKFSSLADSQECQIEFLNNEIPSTVRLFINNKNIEQLLTSGLPEQNTTTNLVPEEVSLLAVNTRLPETEFSAVDESNQPEIEQEILPETEEQQDIPAEGDREEIVQETLPKIEGIQDNTVVETNQISEIPAADESFNTYKPEIVQENLPETEQKQDIAQKDIPETEQKPVTVQESNTETKQKPDISAEDENLNTCKQEIVQENLPETEQKQDVAQKDITESEQKLVDENLHTRLPEAKKEAESEPKLKPEISESLGTCPPEGVQEIPEMIDESFTTAIDDSTETIKDTSLEEKSVIFTETNQDNNTAITISCNKIENTNEQEKLDHETAEPIISQTDENIAQVISSEVEQTQETYKTQTTPLEDTNEQEKLYHEIAEPIISQTDENIAQEVISSEVEPTQETYKTQTTPRSEKIVPGSICRGDLELPSEEIEEYIEIIPPQIETLKSRPVTPRSEKIVPGSICRGSLEEIPPGYEDESIPVIPISEKIVPGAICRGDLEKPPQESKSEIVPETVILEEIRPKTPIEDKIVPGSINKGVDIP